jgi:hypothetical protein
MPRLHLRLCRPLKSVEEKRFGAMGVGLLSQLIWCHDAGVLLVCCMIGMLIIVNVEADKYYASRPRRKTVYGTLNFLTSTFAIFAAAGYHRANIILALIDRFPTGSTYESAHCFTEVHR